MGKAAIFGTLSLGELIALLKTREPGQEVRFDFCGTQPVSVASYRGFYDHLAVGWSAEYSNERTVLWVLNMLDKCIDDTFCGYKGGEYLMTADTPIWVASRGEADSTAIVGLDERCNYMTVIKTEHVNV